VRAECGTAIIATGVGVVADNKKACADFGLNADRAKIVLRSTKEAKKSKIAQLHGPVITGNAENCLRDLLKILRKSFPGSGS